MGGVPQVATGGAEEYLDPASAPGGGRFPGGEELGARQRRLFHGHQPFRGGFAASGTFGVYLLIQDFSDRRLVTVFLYTFLAR